MQKINKKWQGISIGNGYGGSLGYVKMGEMKIEIEIFFGKKD